MLPKNKELSACIGIAGTFTLNNVGGSKSGYQHFALKLVSTEVYLRVGYEARLTEARPKTRVVTVLASNKLEVVASVENRLPTLESIPEILGLVAGVPNKLGTDVVRAPKVPPNPGAALVAVSIVLSNAEAEVARVPNVLPNVDALLVLGVPKLLPNTGAVLAAEVPKVLPNDGADDATGKPNHVDPTPVKTLVVIIVAPKGEPNPVEVVGCVVLVVRQFGVPAVMNLMLN
ncbi:hypothetical protein QE152_g10691 [Popillia japonica]|uniref:Uncharacterized protein n=1 Tax=Popillia japonica TaxID=7064 RepID=A0AAW1LT63_POPJA